MSLKSRRELLCSLLPNYMIASKTERQLLLDQFTSATGYSRKHAIGLLSKGVEVFAEPEVRKRRTALNAEAMTVLSLIWNICSRICGKRLVGALPEILENLERHGHVTISPEAKRQLLSISAATIDRSLKAERTKVQRSLSLTRRSSLVKNKVPIRTFSEWNDVIPGFFEIDTVGHSSSDPGGPFLHTLNMTDIATCWTVPIALRRKVSGEVLRALDTASSELPFPLLGLDSDNGSEFLNADLIAWAEQRELTYTRSRQYKKNDQAWIEEKNRSLVRKHVGRERFEGDAAFNKLCELYAVLALYFNFFLPCQKLVAKSRDGAKTRKRHDRAKTPYQRVLDSPHVSSGAKRVLRAHYRRLDAFQLYEKLTQLQSELRVLAVDLGNPVLSVISAQRNATHKFVAAMRSYERQNVIPNQRRGLIPDLERLVTTHKPGSLVRPRDFAEYDSSRDVARALSLLAKRGILTRVQRGLYCVTGHIPVPSSIQSQLDGWVGSLKPGDSFKVSSVLNFGKRATVVSCVSRLVHKGVLKHVGKGVYQKPAD